MSEILCTVLSADLADWYCTVGVCCEAGCYCFRPLAVLALVLAAALTLALAVGGLCWIPNPNFLSSQGIAGRVALR